MRFVLSFIHMSRNSCLLNYSSGTFILINRWQVNPERGYVFSFWYINSNGLCYFFKQLTQGKLLMSELKKGGGRGRYKPFMQIYVCSISISVYFACNSQWPKSIKQKYR